MAQRRKRNRKWLWCLIVVVLIICVVAGVFVWQNNRGTDNANDSRDESNNSVEEKDTNKTTESTETTTPSQSDTYTTETIEKQKIVQYEGGDPNTSNDLSGVVTYAGVVDGVLMVRVSIDQYLANGTCELNLTRSGATIYSDNANIIGDVSTATCEGFNVPINSIGGGNVEIIINLNSDGRAGVIRGEATL